MSHSNRATSSLNDFIDGLRGKGFNVGTEQYIAAMNLAAMFVLRDELSAGPSELRDFLGPVLCSSRDEQENFKAYFDQWVNSQPTIFQIKKAVEHREKRTAKTSAQPRSGTSTRVVTPRNAILALITLVVAALLTLIIIKEITAPAPTTAANVNPTSSPTVPPTPVGSSVILALSLLGAGSLIYLIIRRVRTSKRRSVLKKGRDLRNPKTQDLMVKGAREQLPQLLSLRRTAQELRRYRPATSSALDVNRTIDMTVRRGLFTPSYTLRRSSPEYLVLVDRANLNDQRARLTSEILSNLSANGVFIEQYSFQGDPTICRAHGPKAGKLSLSDLAERHPEHCLLIFSTGEAFFDPLTGHPSPWLDRLSLWDDRFLLSSEIQTGGYRSSVLQQLGLPVLPPDSAGMIALSEQLQGDTFPTLPNVKPLPALLRSRPNRWTEEHAPAPEIIKELIAQLREFLRPEGYIWLAACAVYPKLYWDLTLYLGLRTVNQVGFDWKLSELVRLPWFRNGSMPDWLRIVLILGLEEKVEQRIRASLWELLETSLKKPEGFILPIVFGPGQQKMGRWRELKSMRRFGLNKLLLKRFNEISPDAPLNDYVFVDFMMGREPDPLVTPLPAEVRKLFPSKRPELDIYVSNSIVAIGSVILILILWAISGLGPGVTATIILALGVGLSSAILQILKPPLGSQAETWPARPVPVEKPEHVPQTRAEVLERFSQTGLTIFESYCLNTLLASTAVTALLLSVTVGQTSASGTVVMSIMLLWGILLFSTIVLVIWLSLNSTQLRLKRSLAAL